MYALRSVTQLAGASYYAMFLRLSVAVASVRYFFMVFRIFRVDGIPVRRGLSCSSLDMVMVAASLCHGHCKIKARVFLLPVYTQRQDNSSAVFPPKATKLQLVSLE